MALIDVADIPKGARLELRWKLEGTDIAGRVTHTCEYLLLIPLQEHDIRLNTDECEDGMIRHRFSTTTDRKKLWPGEDPMINDDRIVLPYRDKRHAEWDAAHLGGLPVWVTCDSKAMKLEFGPGGNA